MFTGIIEKSIPVLDAAGGDDLRRITLAVDWPDLRHGESVAVNGVCLTVADLSPGRAQFDVIRDTLDKTNLGRLKTGDLVHVERSLRVGDRLDGHFVQGHVDGVAKLIEKTSNGDDVRLRIELPASLEPSFAPKGSVAIDGVSLTIADIGRNWFEVALIPTTLAITQLGRRAVGYAFNIECDMIAKTVVRFLELRNDRAATPGLRST
jgi:riboflavin synthase